MAEKSDSEDTLGSDNTIPDTEEGVSVGHGEASNFEPEEDEHADDSENDTPA